MMSSRKKVCIVGPSKRFTSGISYYTIRLANAMSQLNNVSVICFRQLLPTFLFPGKGRVGNHISNLDFEPQIDIFDEMDYNNPVSWFKAYKAIKIQNPDVIILQWWTSSVAHMHLLIKLFLKLRDNTKLFIEFHEVVDPLEESILPIKLYSKIMGMLIRRNLDGYITHSKSDKNLVSKRYNIDLNKIHVLPHGLYDHYGESIGNLEAKKKLNISEQNVILSFGLIRKYKGIPYLIDAFEQLPKEIIKKSRLLIVGEIWDDQKEIVSRIISSPYSDQITLVDEYVPDELVSLYFDAANVVVMPYLRASQSGIAHIAMTFGKPIIVSEVGGLKESMVDYEGTFFIRPANEDDIKEEIINLFGNSKLYHPPKRTWDLVVKDYNNILFNA